MDTRKTDNNPNIAKNIGLLHALEQKIDIHNCLLNDKMARKPFHGFRRCEWVPKKRIKFQLEHKTKTGIHERLVVVYGP
jgi:hypothetical protein